jgi:hypothetical protein
MGKADPAGVAYGPNSRAAAAGNADAAYEATVLSQALSLYRRFLGDRRGSQKQQLGRADDPLAQ